MANLTLYTHPQSRGRTVHWLLEELQVPYDTVWLDFGTTMKAPEYLAINPLGKVPALKHGDAVLTESAAICAYLADHFVEKGLIPPPRDPARAAFFRWLFFAAGPLESAIVARLLDWHVPEGRSGMVGFGSYEAAVDALENALIPGPWICGEQFTAADVYVGANISFGMRFGTLEKRPAFEQYAALLEQRPAARRAEEINQARLDETAAG